MTIEAEEVALRSPFWHPLTPLICRPPSGPWKLRPYWPPRFLHGSLSVLAPFCPKDYILPLIFLKRLSDVFDDELASLAHQFGDAATAAQLAEQDHGLVRVYLPPEARWPAIAAQTTRSASSSRDE